MKELIPLTGLHPGLIKSGQDGGQSVDLNPTEHLWDIMLWARSRSSVMPWPRSGRRFPSTTSIIYSTILSCYCDILANWTSPLHHFFFTCVSLNSALCRLIVFISIKLCDILSFLTHYTSISYTQSKYSVKKKHPHVP